MLHIDPACRLLTAFRSRRRREEVGWLYGTGHTEEPRRQREDRKFDATCIHEDCLLTMLQQTDGARNMFEKATGKNVPEKFSN